MRAAIADLERFACEPKVDGVRGLLIFRRTTGGGSSLYERAGPASSPTQSDYRGCRYIARTPRRIRSSTSRSRRAA